MAPTLRPVEANFWNSTYYTISLQWMQKIMFHGRTNWFLLQKKVVEGKYFPIISISIVVIQLSGEYPVLRSEQNYINN